MAVLLQCMSSLSAHMRLRLRDYKRNYVYKVAEGKLNYFLSASL